MCGIIGYIGEREALPLLLDGLRMMEYRGYDSAGVAVRGPAGIRSIRAVGKVASLEAKLRQISMPGTLGGAHERWATHGGVTEANAHPHTDCAGRFWVIHNGIIENYQELKTELLLKGHVFRSETDTEVIAHLLEDIAADQDVETAISQMAARFMGTYGLIILDNHAPDKLIAVRNFSPLVLGIGEKEYFAASDPAAFLKHTDQVVYLADGETAILTRTGYRVYDRRQNLRQKQVETVDWKPEEAQKSGHPHFMLKEILEEPEAVRNSIRGRLIPTEGLAKLGGLEAVRSQLEHAARVVIAACGTSYFSAKTGEYMLEECAGIPVEVDYASEFRYRAAPLGPQDVFIAVSQSGETADTLAALREARKQGALTLGIVNIVGSTIARESDAGVYQHIGPEISVASTKAFLSQITIFALLALFIGRAKNMPLAAGLEIAAELQRIPQKIQTILDQRERIRQLAEKHKDSGNIFYLGRKYNFPAALEGALKLKETAYIHAEGCGAGELKHGPLALVSPDFPTVAIAPRDSVYAKMLSNIEEVKARGGPVIAIGTEGDENLRKVAAEVIYVPETLEMLTPLLTTVPLQLFAYYASVARGNDVDHPRNLAKSVTVE